MSHVEWAWRVAVEMKFYKIIKSIEFLVILGMVFTASLRTVWVSIPSAWRCEGKTLKEEAKLIAQATCQQKEKHYLGKWRCNKGIWQVKCN